MLLSCNQQNQKYQKRYIDLDSLISSQLVALTKANVNISKKASMGQSETTGVAKGDSASLSHELDIFRQIDIINKPLFRDQYVVLTAPDTKSNLTVQSFEPKIQSPIRYVKLYYLNDVSHLKKIEARYEEENSLYYTRRDYVLEFNEYHKSALLVRSNVQGIQKMIMNDSVTFSVTSLYQAAH